MTYIEEMDMKFEMEMIQAGYFPFVIMFESEIEVYGMGEFI